MHIFIVCKRPTPRPPGLVQKKRQSRQDALVKSSLSVSACSDSFIGTLANHKTGI
jgi:hypothetical protein